MDVINSCNFVGRFTRDPEYNDEGKTARVKFGIAVPRRFADKQTGKREADFLEFVAFGGTATFINKYFAKGDPASITSRCQTSNWVDKEGNKHYMTNFLVETIEFAGSKGSNNAESQPDAATPAPKDKAKADDEFMDIPTDSSYEAVLPFN